MNDTNTIVDECQNISAYLYDDLINVLALHDLSKPHVK